MTQQWTRMVAGTTWLLAAAVVGCSSTDDNNSGSNKSGTAGTMSSSAAGSSAGSTASAAGGSAPAATGPFSCGPASTKSPAELYAAAAGAFLPKDASSMTPCAFGPCHNANKKIAMLALPAGGDLTSILVNKPSCEAPNLKLVEPGGGDAALAKSYLYLKLAAPVDGSGNLLPKPEWGTPSLTCGQMMDFGARMPVGAGDMGVGEEKLAIMREWICAGAPGPM